MTIYGDLSFEHEILFEEKKDRTLKKFYGSLQKREQKVQSRV